MPASNNADAPLRRWPRRDERGGSTSMMAVVLTPALLVAVGLVVDGGGRLNAIREADAAAQEAARAGADAGAGSLVSGSGIIGTEAATQAAQNYLADAGVAGTVSVSGRTITVTATKDYDTILLSLISIESLEGKATATAEIVTTG